MYVKNYKSIKIRTCRVCLVTELTNCVLVDYDDEWRQMLEFCVGISIHKQEEPRMLCTKCLCVLSKYFQFKKQCLVSDELWKSFAYDRVSCSVEKCKADIEIDSESEWVDIERLSDGAEVNIENETSNLDVYSNIENCCTDESFILYVCDDQENNSQIKEIVDDNKDVVNTSVFEVHKETKILTEAHKENNETQKKDIYHGDITKPILNPKKRKPKVRKVYHPLKRKSDGSITYGCGLCKYTAISQCKIREHFQEHVLSNDLKCKICDFAGHDFAEVVAHRLSHCTPEFVVVGCPVCTKVLLANMTLQFHYRSVHMKMSGGYCAKCNLYFKRIRGWANHVREHSSGRKFTCDICGAKFRTKYQIKEHIQIHSSIYPHVCHICGKKFKRHLKLHMDFVHNTQAVKCTVCSKTYKNKFALKNHMMYAHTRKLQCETCGKYFGRSRDLEKHMILHSDYRPQKCEICEKRFKSKSNLNAHLRTHYQHTRYQCDICQRDFSCSSALKRHKAAIHMGIRSFQCTLCDRSFYTRKLLRIHCLKMHRVDVTT